MNNTNTTNPNLYSMGTVNLNTGVSTPTQNTPVTPIQPATIPNSQNISTFSTQPITLPTQNLTQPAPQLNQAEQILQQTAVQDTQNQKDAQSLSKSMLTLIPQLQGQTQALADAQAQVGLPGMRQNLQNINNQILTKQAELNQDEIRLAQSVQNIEDKPIALDFIVGQQQSVQRNAQIARALKASEIGVLNATALGMQGNIALAEATAKQAVETKFAPYKEALDTYKLQLEALQPILTSDEKKQAREQEIKTSLALKEIDKKQKQEETITNMIINASSQNAPQALLAKAKATKDPAQAAMILGEYAGDYYKTQLLKAEINKTYAQTRVANQALVSTPGAEIEKLPKAIQERYYKLQNDFDSATKNYRGAIDAAANLNALSKDATAQDQTAIIFSYMKALDPTSTVREGEFALVASTAGLGDRATNALKKLDNGQRLNDDQIKDIVGASTKLANVAKQNLDATSKEFDRRAVKFGIPAGQFYEPQGKVTSTTQQYLETIKRGLSPELQLSPSSYLQGLKQI